jgi:hypothetical protein
MLSFSDTIGKQYAIVDLSAILSGMPPSRSQSPQVVQILKSLAQ